MYYYDPKERATKELAPGARTRTFWGDKLTLSLVEIDADSLVPKHAHPHEQGGIIIEGEVELGVAGEVRLLKPGEMYVIPGDVEHYAKTGTTPVKLLDVFSPVREEFKY